MVRRREIMGEVKRKDLQGDEYGMQANVARVCVCVGGDSSRALAATALKEENLGAVQNRR